MLLHSHFRSTISDHFDQIKFMSPQVCPFDIATKIKPFFQNENKSIENQLQLLKNLGKRANSETQGLGLVGLGENQALVTLLHV